MLFYYHSLENKKKFKDAEVLYLTCNEPDLAINMYRNNQLYDQMIVIVEKYHKELLIETYLRLAKQLENEGNLKSAELYYIKGCDYKTAVEMYCQKGIFEEGYRVFFVN